MLNEHVYCRMFPRREYMLGVVFDGESSRIVFVCMPMNIQHASPTLVRRELRHLILYEGNWFWRLFSWMKHHRRYNSGKKRGILKGRVPQESNWVWFPGVERGRSFSASDRNISLQGISLLQLRVRTSLSPCLMIWKVLAINACELQPWNEYSLGLMSVGYSRERQFFAACRGKN